jgi:flagellar hook protein FlgE
MSIFAAMNTAVAGLQAQSFALENISDNIANSQTTGYKRVDTSFEELVPEFPLRQQIGGSVIAFSRGTNNIAGNITATGVGTNMALSGGGYMVVRDRVSYAGGVPTFAAKDLYTRRGDFELDKNGYLVNGAGNYLVGNVANATTGIIGTGSPTVLQFSGAQIPAQPTSTIDYRANLPSSPTTTGGGTNLTPSGQATITKTGESAFLGQTIAGGSVTAYDVLGSPVTMQLRWGKTTKADATATPPTVDTWDLFYSNSPTSTAGTAVAWTNAGTFTFGPTGQLTSSSSVTMTAPTIGGTTLGNITFDVGSGGLTQFSDISGQVKPNQLKQNGYAAGTLEKIAVNDAGQVMASYSNGQSKPVAQVAIAQFAADNSLKRLDGGTFEQTLESGEPIYSVNGTGFIAGSLEGSNTDIAQEFSKMIITQQAYSANTRVVSTAQQMLQDAINIIR